MAESITLNNRMLEALKPDLEAQTRIEFRDKSEDGLYLFLTPQGRKSFYFYKKYRGRPLRLKIGRFPDLSVSAARAKVRELKGQLALGQDLAQPANPPTLVTLNQVVESYFEQKGNSLRPATVRVYRLTIRKHLAPWKETPLAKIEKDQVVRLHRKITKENGAPSADLAMRVFRALFQFFIDRHDFTGTNPVNTLSQNRLWNTGPKDRRQSILTKEDILAWFRCVMQWQQTSERDFLLTLFVTGMRRTEAAEMRWENIDWKKKCFVIPTTKNHRPLHLPMSHFLEELLRSRHRTSAGPFVFPSAKKLDKPLDPTSTAKRVSKVSGVKFMLHDLRRTFATAAESLDISMETIKRLINHKSGADVTSGYIIHDVERLREPAERVASHLLELAGHSSKSAK